MSIQHTNVCIVHNLVKDVYTVLLAQNLSSRNACEPRARRDRDAIAIHQIAIVHNKQAVFNRELCKIRTRFLQA